MELTRWDRDTVRFSLTHELAEVHVYRSKDFTALVVPKHGVAFVGRGDVEGPDTLDPHQGLRTFLSPGSMVTMASALMGAGPHFVADAMIKYGKLSYRVDEDDWHSKDGNLQVISRGVGQCHLKLEYKGWQASVAGESTTGDF